MIDYMVVYLIIYVQEAETTTKDLMEKVTQLQLEKMKRMGSLGAI